MNYNFADSIQRGIIYLLKNDLSFFPEIDSLVKESYFEFKEHQLLFKVISKHLKEYHTTPTDDIILQYVKESGVEDTSNYEDELVFVQKMQDTAMDNREYFLNIIEKYAKRSELIEAIKKSVILINEEKFEEVESLVKKAVLVGRNVDTGQNYFEDIDGRWTRLTALKEGDRVPTGFPRLDKELEGGLARKELGMVVAPPGVGKSLFLVRQGLEALKLGCNVLHVTAELSEDRVAQRYDTMISHISKEYIPGEMEKFKGKLGSFRAKYGNGSLVIKEYARATSNTLRILLNDLRNYEDFVPDVLVVDYLELLRPTEGGLAEYQAQEMIAREFRAIAMESNIVVWTATQTNRQGRMVTLITDMVLGDSYGKIRPCDYVFSINQTEEEYTKGQARLYVMKSRNGKQKFIVPTRINYNTLNILEDITIKTDETSATKQLRETQDLLKKLQSLKNDK